MKREPIRIVCVDDHAFLVEGFRTRVDQETDLVVVAHLERPASLIEVVRETGAHLVLMDIEMPGPPGAAFDAIAALGRACPGVRAILLSAFVCDRYVDLAFKSGAWGYLTKNDRPEVVIEGIRRVMAGETIFSDEVLERSVEVDEHHRALARPTASKFDTLTNRELEVLQLMAEGLGRVEIADRLCRSAMTIDNHRKSMLKKLGLKDRADLVRYAIAERLVSV